MAIEPEEFDNLTALIGEERQWGIVSRGGVDGACRECKRRSHRVLAEPGMGRKHLPDRFSGGHFLQNQLDGNPRASDDRLAHHDAGIGNDHLSVIPLDTSVPRPGCEVIRIGVLAVLGGPRIGPPRNRSFTVAAQ
jgi:hypothetical protein